jgi:hypothetical protein
VAGVETKVVGREYLRVAASGGAAVRLATLYAPTSTTCAALHTRRREAEASGFLKFLEDKAEKAGAEVLKKLKELVEEGEVRGMSRLVGLGEEGVKILEAGAELRDDRPYAIIRALVDGVDVYKIRFPRKTRREIPPVLHERRRRRGVGCKAGEGYNWRRAPGHTDAQRED